MSTIEATSESTQGSLDNVTIAVQDAVAPPNNVGDVEFSSLSVDETGSDPPEDLAESAATVPTYEQEKQAVLELLDDQYVEAFSTEFAVVVCHATYYRRIILNFHFPEGYPDSAKAIVQLESEALPAKLLNKISSMCTEAIDTAYPKPQVYAVVKLVDDLVQRNLLLYATPEVRQVVAASKEMGFKVLVNENEGTLKLRANQGKYNLRATIAVPQGYPAEQLQIKFESSTFPSTLAHMFEMQAEELARRCSIGCTTAEAKSLSNPVKGDPNAVNVASIIAKREVQVTADVVANLKHDVAFLKKATDLRNVNASYNKQLHKHEYSTETRRRARRELKKLSAQEAAAEQAQIQEAMDAEKRELERQRAAAIGDRSPQRCLRFIIVDFLVKEFAIGLPKYKCVVSGKELFPSDPKELEKLLNSRKRLRPARGSCGCWFSFVEIEKVITNPPFGLECPSCGRRVCHPNFSTDLKQLEKQWSTRKAREREVSEVSDFLDIGDEFAA